MQRNEQGGQELTAFQGGNSSSLFYAAAGTPQRLSHPLPTKTCKQEDIFGLNPAQIPSWAAIPLHTAALPA